MQMNRDGKSRAVMLILQMALYILGILEVKDTYFGFTNQIYVWFVC